MGTVKSGGLVKTMENSPRITVQPLRLQGEKVRYLLEADSEK